MENTRKFLSCSLIYILVISLFMTACVDYDEYDSGIKDEEMEGYEDVLTLQDDVDTQLEIWFTSMDSLDAIKRAQQEFANDPSVSSAIISSQGISVQYANGMRGGLFLNPEDDSSGMGEEQSFDNLTYESGKGLKSLVNKRKMILINPHYWERIVYADYIETYAENSLDNVDMTLSKFYKNEEATVDRFTELSGYGIINIYTHGMAWPKRENITDVYLLTGERANDATSKKYWGELKDGNIPIMKVNQIANKYFLSPRFLREHNDFSKDTILFYGGFCYSFLGDWPDIIDDFGDGAYTGYDWSVYTNKNVDWFVNSLFYYCDTSAEQPITLNDWFNRTDVSKFYWNDDYERIVSIMYAGDGNLKLWGGEEVRLVPLSSDGSPVNTPGEVGVAYPFKCEINTDKDLFLEYIWDIGDGSPPVTESSEVNIIWNESGQYTLKVDVVDKFDGKVYGTASLSVTIEEEEVWIKEWITKSNVIDFSFDFAKISFDDGIDREYPSFAFGSDVDAVYNLSGQQLTIDNEKSWEDVNAKLSLTQSIIIDFSPDFSNILKFSLDQTFSHDGYYFNWNETATCVIENIPYEQFFGNPGEISANITYGLDDGDFQNGMKDFNFTYYTYDKRKETTDEYAIESIDWTAPSNFYLAFMKKK